MFRAIIQKKLNTVPLRCLQNCTVACAERSLRQATCNCTRKAYARLRPVGAGLRSEWCSRWKTTYEFRFETRTFLFPSSHHIPGHAFCSHPALSLDHSPFASGCAVVGDKTCCKCGLAPSLRACFSLALSALRHVFMSRFFGGWPSPMPIVRLLRWRLRRVGIG